MLERLVVASPRDVVTAEEVVELTGADRAPPGVVQVAPGAPDGAAATSVERDQVAAALVQAGYVQAKAARLLGLSVRQLRYRVAKYGLVLRRF